MGTDQSRTGAAERERAAATHPAGATDYLELMLAECRDLAAFLETLSEQQWHAPSLCRGWQVRDVIAHMAVGHTTPVWSMAASLARHRFSMDRTSYALATGYARSHTPAQILALFREATAGPPRAASRLVPVHELFTDHLVHHQDIRRPLGLSRQIPVGRSVAALQALHRMRTVGGRGRMRGLHVIATDVDFQRRDGDLELRGPAEALVMAVTGRAAVLPELSGSGLATLARRIGRPMSSAPA